MRRQSPGAGCVCVCAGASGEGMDGGTWEAGDGLGGFGAGESLPAAFEWTGYGHGCTGGALAARVKPFGRAGAVWCMLCFGRFSRVEERRIPADWKRCRPVRLRRGLRTAPVRDKKNGGPNIIGPPFLLSTFSVAPLRQLMLRRSGSWLGEAASMSIWSFTIWMAAAAASSPLLPRRPPQRSSACCMSLTVSTPKAMGMFH